MYVLYEVFTKREKSLFKPLAQQSFFSLHFSVQTNKTDKNQSNDTYDNQ